MKYRVEFYRKDNGKFPVVDFIDGLSAKQRDKIFRAFQILEKFGSELNFPEVLAIKGKKYQGLWELRIGLATDIFRIFYYIAGGYTAVMLHAIIKKQDKTPARELDIALKRMEEHKEATQ